eukprot:4361540-Prorocentrum_lima.AAC.1
MALCPGGKQSTLSSEVQWHLHSAGGKQSTLPLSSEVQWRIVQAANNDNQPCPLLRSGMGITQDCAHAGPEAAGG